MADFTVTKGKLGVEDIEWHDGSDDFERETSTGGTSTINKVSAKDVPVEDDDSMFESTKVEEALEEAKACINATDLGNMSESKNNEQTLAASGEVTLVSTSAPTFLAQLLVVIKTTTADITKVKLEITIDGGTAQEFTAFNADGSGEKYLICPPLKARTASGLTVKLKNTDSGNSFVYGTQLYYITY